MISRARTTPEIERTEDDRIAIGAAKLRNSASSTPNTRTSASISTRGQLSERFLLLLIGPAVLHANTGGKMHRLHTLRGRVHCRSQIRAFEPRGDDDEPLQVFAANFVLRR